MRIVIRVNSDERIHQLTDATVGYHWMKICFQLIRCNFAIAKFTVIDSTETPRKTGLWAYAGFGSILIILPGSRCHGLRPMGGSMWVPWSEKNLPA